MVSTGGCTSNKSARISSSFRNGVLGQELGQAGRQIVVLQHLVHEIAVEHGPRTGVLGRTGLQVFGEFLGDGERAATRLPGNGHRAANTALGAMPRTCRRPELAVDEGQTMFQTGSLNHNDLRSFQTGGAPGSSPPFLLQNNTDAIAFNAIKTFSFMAAGVTRL